MYRLNSNRKLGGVFLTGGCLTGKHCGFGFEISKFRRGGDT